MGLLNKLPHMSVSWFGQICFFVSPLSGFILKPTQYVTFIRDEYWVLWLALSSVEEGLNNLNWVNLVVDMWRNGIL